MKQLFLIAAVLVSAGCMCDDDPIDSRPGVGGSSTVGVGGDGGGGIGGGDGGAGAVGGGGAEPVQALDENGNLVPADYACLGQLSMPAAGPEVTVTLPVLAFGEFDGDGNPVTVSGATVQIYPGGDTQGGACDADCSAATEAAPGLYEASIPSTGWYAYHVEAAGFIPTLENRVAAKPPGEPDWFNLMRRAVLSQLAAAIGTEIDPSKALLSGVVRHCQGRPVSGATLVLHHGGEALVSGDDGFVMAYFSAMGLSTARSATAAPGRWAAVNAPAGAPIRLEVWGAVEAGGEPVLLACELSEAHADTLSSGGLAPLRADAPAGCGG